MISTFVCSNKPLWVPWNEDWSSDLLCRSACAKVCLLFSSAYCPCLQCAQAITEKSVISRINHVHSGTHSKGSPGTQDFGSSHVNWKWPSSQSGFHGPWQTLSQFFSCPRIPRFSIPPRILMSWWIPLRWASYSVKSPPSIYEVVSNTLTELSPCCIPTVK